MRDSPRRYRLTTLLAAVWCLVLLPVQTYVFASPEVPGWLTPLESPLRAVVNQAKETFPHLDPYYTFGRLFFPCYLLLAVGFAGTGRAQGEGAGRVVTMFSNTLVGATAIGGVADAVTYWAGDNPDVSDIDGIQLGAWLVEEIALLVMVAATIAVAVAALRARTMRPGTAIIAIAAGALALPVGFLTYIPHGVVLLLAVAGLLISAAHSRAGGTGRSS